MAPKVQSTTPCDQEIIDLIRSGRGEDRDQGFQALDAKYGVVVMGFLFKQCLDYEVANIEDYYQETLTHLLQVGRPLIYQGEGRLSGLLRKVARNILFESRRRNRKRRLEYKGELPEQEVDLYASLESLPQETMEIVRAAYASLSVEDKVIWSFHSDGVSDEIISQKVGHSVAAIKTRLSRMRDTFMNLWSKQAK